VDQSTAGGATVKADKGASSKVWEADFTVPPAQTRNENFHYFTSLNDVSRSALPRVLELHQRT
jgi:hypothetical protein